jgi:hypothetical protein
METDKYHLLTTSLPTDQAQIQVQVCLFANAPNLPPDVAVWSRLKLWECPREPLCGVPMKLDFKLALASVI